MRRRKGPAGNPRQNRRQRRRRRRRRVVLIGGTVALGAVAVRKFTKKDVEKIEAAAGKPAEELSDEELQQITQKLGIQGEPLTAEEQKQVDAAEREAGN